MQKLLINKIINGHKIKLKLTIKLWTPVEVNFSGVFSYAKVFIGSETSTVYTTTLKLRTPWEFISHGEHSIGFYLCLSPKVSLGTFELPTGNQAENQ